MFSVIPAPWMKTGDFEFHFNKASQNCDPRYPESQCDSYYPLLHILGGPFSFSPLAFSNFLMIIVVFLTPLVLYLATRNWIITWFYFSVTQYVYTIQAGGAYPQALAGILLIVFLWQKNIAIRALIILLSVFAHSQAFVLLLIVWLVQLFFENNIHSILVKKGKNIFPACSAIFGLQAEDPIGQKVTLDILNKHGIQTIHITIKDIANFFVRTFPLPFLIMAFWQLKKEKDYALIIIVLIGFYYGIAVAQARIFLIIPLILLPSLTRFYVNLPKKWKKWFIILTFITFLVNFGTWILYKYNCVA